MIPPYRATAWATCRLPGALRALWDALLWDARDRWAGAYVYAYSAYRLGWHDWQEYGPPCEAQYELTEARAAALRAVVDAALRSAQEEQAA